MFGRFVCLDLMFVFGCVYDGVLLWVLVLSDCGFGCEFAFVGVFRSVGLGWCLFTGLVCLVGSC